MLCLNHGYALSGSGSNLWTRSVIDALCRNGHTVHLTCQDRRPEQYPFVAAAYEYAPDGEPTLIFERSVDTRGKCILHRPRLDILPVYVQPPAGIDWMIPIPDMTDDQIEDYLDRNERAIAQIASDHGITAMHVNHVVLLSEAVRRVSERTGIPYAVMPHGSAIEYVAKRDPRMHRVATTVLNRAERILILSDELRGRLLDTFPEVREGEAHMAPTSVGVNTDQFDIIPREQRQENIRKLKASIADLPRGKEAAYSRQMEDRLLPGITLAELQELIATTGDYPRQRPDAGLEERLDGVDWSNEKIILFVGKIIGFKGVPSLVAAFPLILDRHPSTRLILAGRGPLREALEAMIAALGRGDIALVRRMASWGSALEEGEEAPFDRLEHFYDELEREGQLDEYARAARQHDLQKRILFTGHIEHKALACLFPCCDVAVFPSVVAEAGPLVLFEAMASGCFPMGTYFAGMGANLDVAARAVSPEQAPLMRLRPEAEHTVNDIAHNASEVLALEPTYREALREITLRHYDWRPISEKLATDLQQMAAAAQ